MKKNTKVVISAVLVATLFSLWIGFGGWILNHSPLPPMGGGVWKLVVIPSVGTWILIFALVCGVGFRKGKKVFTVTGSTNSSGGEPGPPENHIRNE